MLGVARCSGSDWDLVRPGPVKSNTVVAAVDDQDKVTLEFRVLGPLEVRRGGRLVDIGTPKQRVVLALLLSDVNRVVSVDRILETLWGDDPPATAIGTLQSYVSGLRRLLEPFRLPRAPAEVLVTRPPGYMIAVDPAAVDSVQFESMVTSGSKLAMDTPLQARIDLEAALALWRGTPFVDLLDESGSLAAVVRLEEMRRGAHERLFAVRLALGEHAAIVGDLEQFVADEPLREFGWELLATAQYRSGRQTDALRTLARVRSILADEVGLEPGARLVELQRRIYEQDPSLDAPDRVDTDVVVPEPSTAMPTRPAPRPPSSDGSVFVGRSAQLAAIRGAVERSSAGRGALVLVVGEAGVGKTTLVEVALKATSIDGDARGPLVLWGRSPEGEGAPAYWPWAQVLSSIPELSDHLATQPELGRLANIVPNLASDAGSAAARGNDPAIERFLLAQSVTTVLRMARERERLVVVLEDLHWADASSLRVLEAVAGHLEAIGVVVVATFRPEETASNPALADALGSIARERAVTRIDLEGLDLGDVATFVEATTQLDDAAVVGVLHERTDGNPFFLVELVRLLTSGDRLRGLAALNRPETTIGVPQAVRDVVLRRLARLPDATRDVLAIAAVAGRDVQLEMLEVAAGVDPDEILDRLDPAIAMNLLLEVSGRFGVYAFSHAIVRDALYESLGPAQRARLHKRVGDATAALSAADPSGRVGELAHHYSMAMPLGTAEAALTWSVRAAEQATGQLADDRAAEMWALAIDAHRRAHPDDLPGLLDLQIALARSHRRNWDLVAATEALHQGVETAVEFGEPIHIAKAASVFGQLSLWNWRNYGETNDRIIVLLRDAIDQLPPDADDVRALALGTLAVELYYSETSRLDGEGERCGREAVAIARRLDDAELLARTLNNLFISIWRPDNTDQLLAITEELLALDNVSQDVEATAVLHRGPLLIKSGRFDRASIDWTNREAIAARTRNSERLGQFEVQAATLSFIDGRLDEASRRSEDAWARVQASSTWGTEWVYALQQFVIRRERGNVEGIVDHILALSRRADFDVARPLALLAQIEAGRLDEARAMAAATPLTIRRDWAFDVVAAQWADVAVELESDLREPILEVITPFVDTIVVAGTLVACLGPMHQFVGRLKASLGDHAAGIEHLDYALESARALDAPVIEARVALHLAELQAAHGGPSGRRAAADVASRALAQCVEVGMPALARRLRSLDI